jgi:hypothetical protein
MRLPTESWWETWEALLAWAHPPTPTPLPAEDPALRSFVRTITQGHARASLQRVRQGRQRHRRR